MPIFSEDAMNRTSNDQRSDAHNPTSDEHQHMLDNKSGQIKQNVEDKESKPQGASGDPQVSVPPDFPKE